SEHEHDFKVVGILQPAGSVVDQLILTNTQSIWEVHEHQQTEAAEAKTTDSTALVEAEIHDHEMHENEPTSLLDEPEKEITSILVRVKKEALTNPRYIQMLNEFRKHPSIQVTQTSYEVDKLLSNFDTGTNALKALAWVIVGVSGLSIFISLFSSLKERKYELALMRVMGGSPGTLFNLILLEGLLLAVLGYGLGILFSHLGMSVLAGFMEDKYRYSFDGWQFMAAEFWLLAGALAVGFVAAVIPAWQARRTDISKTLAQG
ncbi:MAG: ABC transporter permease, partial [Bacteroidota bacterium]